MIALKHRERRLHINAPCCPWLCKELETVLDYYNSWFFLNEDIPTVEIVGDALPEGQEKRTGLFLSGGVDSTFALWENHQRLPKGHPGRISEGILLKGFEIRIDQESASSAFDRAIRSIQPVAGESDISLIPLVTNLRQIDPDGDFWGLQFQGAILAASAHALAPRFSDVILAASTDIDNIVPYGTHPAVDPHLSSYGLRIHHQGERYTRIDKLRRIAPWQTAIDNLRVCSKAPESSLNCGVCEKCIRVKLELMVVGKLRTSRAFEDNDVTAEMIQRLEIEKDAVVFFERLRFELVAIGRPDLAWSVMRCMIRDLPRRMTKHLEDSVKNFDKVFFDQRLRRWIVHRRRMNA